MKALYKNHRLKNFDYSTDGYYHIEFNTKYRTHDFGEVIEEDDHQIFYSKAGKILEEEWFRSGELRNDITLGKFKIMPDHFHGIIQIGHPILPEYISPYEQYSHVPFSPEHKNRFGPQHRSLSNIVGCLKAACTRKVQAFKLEFAWQTSFYDVVIRDLVQLNNTETYIENNIVVWKNEKKKVVRKP